MLRTWLAATLLMASFWPFSAVAEKGDVQVGILTCAVGEPAEAASVAALELSSRDAVCIFLRTSGAEETYTGKLQDLAGCCSVSVMLDRTSGRSVLTTTYDSPQDMAAAKDRAMAMREEFTQQMNRRITDVAEFDLVLAHLRVPEMV